MDEKKLPFPDDWEMAVEYSDDGHPVRGIIREIVHHNEQTLHKVSNALRRAGLGAQQAIDAISEMQNAGILFRERGE